MNKVDFVLTEDQFTMLQHLLPKRYILRKESSLHKKMPNQKHTNRSSIQMSFNSNESPYLEMETNLSKSGVSKQNSLDLSSTLKPKQNLRPFDKCKMVQQKKDIRFRSKKLYTEILEEIEKKNSAEIFLEPVDHVALQIPQYFTIIKEPMDLKTMKKKVKKNIYKSVEDFKKDLTQIVWNCLRFNAGNNYYIKIAQKFDQDCRKILQKNRQRIQYLSVSISKYDEFSDTNNSLQQEKSSEEQIVKQPNSKKNKQSKLRKKQESNPETEQFIEKDIGNDILKSKKKDMEFRSVKQKSQKEQSYNEDEQICSSKIKITKSKIKIKISNKADIQSTREPDLSQSLKEKVPDSVIFDKNWKLKILQKIGEFPKEKREDFFKMIDLAKGQQLDFQSLSNEKVLKIELKLNQFMKQ